MAPTARAKKGAACELCAKRKRKCTHFATTTTELVRLKRPSKPLLQYIPSCGETQLCGDFVSTLKCLNVDHTWLAMLPCRLGQSEIVDSAIRAVVKNKDLALKNLDTPASGSLSDYVRAVETLRVAMQDPTAALTDEILVTVALLSVTESLMRSQIYQCFAHWTAMKTILLSRPASWPATDISRAILYHIRNQSFHIPCATGTASPFDHPRWYDLEPAWQQTLPPEIAKLKHCYHRLVLRLPRLIMLVRKIRTDPEPDVKTIKQAVQLAAELGKVEDEAAENELLHQIKIIKTLDPEHAKLIPFSFEFPDLGDLETAVTYWSTRLLVGNLQRKLHELSIDTSIDLDATNAKMLRIGVNVMMSYQYARTRPQYAHARGIVGLPPALLTLWAVWEGREQHRGIPIEQWKDWTLRGENEGLNSWGVNITEAEMDETSDLLVGGPLQGMYVAAYRPAPLWGANLHPHVR